MPAIHNNISINRPTPIFSPGIRAILFQCTGCHGTGSRSSSRENNSDRMATTANDDAKCTPTFSGFLNATGHSEMWNLMKVGNQSSDWSSSANEKRYTQGTLIGNWNEDQFDVKEIIKPTPLPSQVRYGAIWLVCI